MPQDRTSTEITNRLGVNVVEGQVLGHLRWLFREQGVSDFGVDAQTEIVEAGSPTGKLLALQIKSGPSGFKEQTQDGWVFRFDDDHARYWRNHALPVVLVLVDIEAQQAYWQYVSEATTESTGKGHKVFVPREHTVGTASSHWSYLASGLAERAAARYPEVLQVLPPVTAKRLRELHARSADDAAVLAVHLADGRRDPRHVVETLLAASPRWLTSPGVDGWRVLAIYAAEHGADELSAAAFLRAAATDPTPRARFLAAAGLQLLGDGGERARMLFTEALAVDADNLWAHLGLAICAHDLSRPGPIALPPGVDLDTEQARQDPTVQSFLAENAARRGDLDTAVNHRARAVDLAPDDSNHLIALAVALTRRSGTLDAQHDDATRARELLEHSVDQRHRWEGDTTEALKELLRVLMLLGDFTAVIARATAAPTGKARPEEAARPVVLRRAVQAAHLLGDSDLARQLVVRLDGSSTARLLRADVLDEPLPTTEATAAWQEALADAETSDAWEEWVTAVLKLAELGVDASGRLAPLVAQGITPLRTQHLAQAIAAARTDLDAALPALRALAEDDVMAAEQLVLTLADARRYDEAVSACERAARTLRQPHLAALRAEILREGGRGQDARAAASEALAQGGLTGVQAARLHALLAAGDAERGDWAAAERHLAQAVALHVPPPAHRVWDLVLAQLHQREARRAGVTVRRYRPAVTDAVAARYWVEAMATEPWDTATTAQALDLARHFAEDAQLCAVLLTHVILTTRTEDPDEAGDGTDPRPLVPRDLHRQALAAIDAHIDRHGDAAGMWRRNGTPDDFLEHVTELLQPHDDAAVESALAFVRTGQGPLGLVCAALNRPYAAGVIHRAAGVQVAAAADDAEHEGEVAAAAHALGGPVIVDAAALMLPTRVPGGDRLRGHFTELRMPAAARDDVVRATRDISNDRASRMTVTRDSRVGHLVRHRTTAGEQEVLLERCTALEAAARRTTAVPVPVLSVLTEVLEEEWREQRDRGLRDGPWLAPVQLARDEDRALWSDDLAVRRIAREAGVPAFGTPALLEHLARRAIETVPEGDRAETAVNAVLEIYQAQVLALVADFVVDLPVHLEDLLVLGEQDQWRPAAAAVVLSRPLWWTTPAEGLMDLRTVLGQVTAHRPAALAAWVRAAMVGAASTHQARPEVAAVLLAAITLLTVLDDAESDSGTATLIAREVAEEHGIPDPASLLPTAKELLHVLTDRNAA